MSARVASRPADEPESHAPDAGGDDLSLRGWRAARRLLTGPLRQLVSGQMLSQAADGLAQIAFAQVVLFEVGEGATPLELTGLLAASLLPFSVVGPVAGIFVDRWERRRILVTVSVARAALMAASPIVLVLDSEALAYVAIVLLLSSSRFVLAAKGAGLPWTVPRDELVTGNSISAIAGMTAAFVGAVVGSAFVAPAPAAGLVGAAALYLVAAVTFRRLETLGGGTATESVRTGLARVGHELREELAEVARRAEVRTPLLAVWAHRLVLGAAFIVLVLVADRRYGLEAPGYGLALAVTGVGAFLGTWLVPGLARRFRPRALLPLTFLPAALAAAVGGFAPNLVVLIAGLGVTALAFQVLKVTTDALLQESATDLVRGRVFSVYDVLYNVAFVLAGLALVPLWELGRESELLWLSALVFLLFGAGLARAQGTWPFESRSGEHGPRGRRAHWAPRVGSLVAGAIPALAFPESNFTWLGFVGLVPLVLLVRRAPTKREGGVRGWLGGIGFFIAIHHWLLYYTGVFTLAIGPTLGLLWWPWGRSVWTWTHDLRSRGGLLGALTVVPAVWVVIEFARSWDRLAGPWGLLGASQWQNLSFLSLAALGGVWLVSFALMIVNMATAVAVSRSTPTRLRVLAAGAAVAVVGAGFGFGHVRPEPTVVGTAEVAGVQAGHVQDGARRFEAHLEMSRSLVGSDLDLVVWGESSVGFDLAGHPGRLEQLTDVVGALDADVLVNVDARRGGQGGIFKTSALVGTDGIQGTYDKMRLVPFGEYIPLRPVFSWASAVTQATEEDRQRGDELEILHTDADGRSLALGPLVCFESAFPDMSRELARDGVDLIALQTATTTFQGTWGQTQHAALSAVRAVESGRPVVHAAVSGVSAAYDATGRRLAWLDSDETGTYRVSLPITEGRTPFVRYRDWMPALSIGIVLTAWLFTGMRSARRGEAVARSEPDQG